mmetsp:Transcript_12769/g.19163  ORF Transcript_12769/g.19163 Transcript_12769/m.19163 type:complete len:798 (-) Transcript_12769:423-2816(-)|eukprot:CAMPEP_0197318962 /NCGR_PEP_ID=MMETSP0891-20130614/52805_1 /TAXON_ID=44058 ORGANISM="Aureoumbra lagunensis, Strain CCMP1510" /NCGR_SAMPLE_ID=MMETSP0891 /ASSEMBLY_ACC=CAM_ASM_000534 /LENGTH=797 /DNA_ID=CAMNT_0042809627 /DNA_START=23 /DNA_END=2416 /DNA_ORIENTATION=+
MKTIEVSNGDEGKEPPVKRTKIIKQQQQEIEFERGKNLGISVDDDLYIRRITDPQSPLVRGARYGVIHWQIIAIDNVPIKTKDELGVAIQKNNRETEQKGIIKLETKITAPISATILASSKPAELQAVLPGLTPTHGPLLSPVVPAPAAPESVSVPSCSSIEVNVGTDRLKNHTNRVSSSQLRQVFDNQEKNERIPPEARRVLHLGDSLPTFRLGNDQVTRLITGSCTWQLSRSDAARSDVAITACAAYTVLGCQTFDCGDIYAGVEDLVGKFLATARGHTRELAHRIRIHTKVIPDLQQGQETEIVELSQLQQALHSRICASVLRSANRLGIANLDLVQLHWWDWHVPGLEVALKVLQTLKSKGLVRNVGITNVDLERLERIIRDHRQQDENIDGPPVACVQVNLSLIDRRPLTSGLPELCKAQGIAFLAHGCLCGGLLSDYWIDKPQPEISSLQPGMALNLVLVQHYGGWQSFQDLLHCLAKIAAKHTLKLAAMSANSQPKEEEFNNNQPRIVTVSMIAIAWTLCQIGVDAIVLGARNCRHVNDAAYAVSSLELDESDLEAIAEYINDSRGPHGPVYGLERFDPRLVALAGSGADGSITNPVNRSSSRATTPDHLTECAKRLYTVYSLYKESMPAIPEDLVDYCAALYLILCSEDNLDSNRKSWMSASAYENLNSTELVQLLRGFVSEIDCIPATNISTIPAPTYGTVTLSSRQLRAFAATMLASSEQARFVQHKQPDGNSSPRTHRASSDAAIAVARASLHSKFVKQLQAGIQKQGAKATAGTDDDGNEPCLLQ